MSEAEGGEGRAIEMAHRLKAVEARLYRLESALPRSDLLSQSFWRRAWAVIGHLLAAVLMGFLVFTGFNLAILVLGALMTGR